MTKLTPIQLCSRCIVNEISNWVFENQLKIEPETIKQIREELQDIKLQGGNCLVCNNQRVSEGCFEHILSILEKYKSDSEIIENYKQFSGMSKTLELCSGF